MTAQRANRGQGEDGTVVTRFAPSPTGRLHLGHAASAIAAYDLARARGGRFLLRIEDLDGTRRRPEHVAAILADLAWLGLEWEGPVFQSERLPLYAAALARLQAAALVYPCFCTRAEIAAASLQAPHGPEPAYPGTCRRLVAPDLARAHSWRLDVAKALAILPGTGRGTDAPRRGGGGGSDPGGPPGAERPPPCPLHGRGPPPRSGEELWWHDATVGWIEADPAAHGDVILARKDAPASYHLAVTVDDAAQGVTDVVRGVDLFAATHVHRLLQALLGLPTPRYHHHPLLTGPDGARLAKRHGSPTLAARRDAGEDGTQVAAALRAGRLPVGFAAASA
ncbi:glutamate--tRNA ligase family protein [uncultured Sphingomonas sp.]|uniref:glutamate--tRNA ligase family protein n=1 Tax=uncultured Sphingomonas sp. TaxID=158754 RepID=UPI0035CC42C3